MRFLTIIILLVPGFLWSQATGPYAPAVGQAGSSAIHKDSSIIQSWATNCTLVRGYLDIANKSLGLASHGDSSAAFGKANTDAVSLGDSGYAQITFNPALSDQFGPELAIFENSFSDTYLELAFVEISSDGVNFVRFPANSLTQITQQVGGFGNIDPTDIHNLAGKYRAEYGTPFDFSDLKDSTSVNIQAITHLRIVDAIGTIAPQHATRDAQGNIINEPYPTNFPSGGFDLDAVAVLNPSSGIGLSEEPLAKKLFYPNPSSGTIQLHPEVDHISVYNTNGQAIFTKLVNDQHLDLTTFQSGMYLLQLKLKSGNTVSRKLILK